MTSARHGSPFMGPGPTFRARMPSIAAPTDHGPPSTAPLRIAGRWTFILLAFTRAVFQPAVWWRPFLVEVDRQTRGTLPLAIFLSGLGGAVTAQQSGYQFTGDLPLWIIGTVVAASVITELAPILAGIAMMGSVGSRIAAELAAMKVTEQVDALSVMGRDPMLHLVVPRVAAGAIVGPIVTVFALAAGMGAGWILTVQATPATDADFMRGVQFYMRDFPLFYALIKGFLFGLSATVISCAVGLRAQGGSEGVGRATHRAVVGMLSALLILDVAVVPLLKVIRW